MAILDDERGQAIQVGAVLIFGFIVVFLAMYQAQVVPNENKQVEAQHSDTVRTQLIQLRNTILQGAATGDAYPVTISLGTDYPPRIFAVNPPPAYGELETTDAQPVYLNNTKATDPEAADYLNGSLAFSTKGFQFTPDYAEYNGLPTVYSSTLLHSTSDGDYLQNLTGQSVISGNTINLVLVAGNLSVEGSQSVAVDPKVVSSGTTLTVRNKSGANVSITIPTAAPVEEWRELVGGNDKVVSVTNASNESIRIELVKGQYQLRIAKLSLGGGATTEPGPEYITVGDAGTSVGENGTQRVSFFVYDKYNNPVSNANVTVSLSSTPSGHQLVSGTKENTSIRVQTDANGEVSVTYEAPENVSGDQTATITASLPSIDGAKGNASTTIKVLDSDGSGDGGGNGDGGTGQITIENARTGSDNSIVLFDVSNQGTANRTITDLAVNSTSSPATEVVSQQGSQATVLIDSASAYGGTINIGGSSVPVSGGDLGSNQTVTITLQDFRTGAGASKTVDMTSETLTVTVFFADGSSTTVQLTVN